MKHLIWSLSIILFCSLSHAQKVSVEKAEQVSYNFLMEQGIYPSDKSASLTLRKMKSSAEDPLFYIFELGEKGFIIISASSKTHPVLAYSFEDPFIENPSVNEFLSEAENQILFIEKNDHAAWPSALKQWEHYTKENFQPRLAKNTAVAPLLTTRWNQDKYYNTYCPWDVSAGAYYDYRVPNGCVALCMAALMDYHRFPEQGTGGVSYTPSPYPKQTVYLNEHTYNYDAMHPKLPFYNGEAAKLVYHAGVMTRMGYNATGSGAYTGLAVQKMTDNFKYSGAARPVYEGTYPDTLLPFYIKILMDELKLRRPILYSGFPSNNTSGHAFIIDGFDADSLFHVNWGWGGAANGYFRINRLAPMGSDYSYNTTAYIDIYPQNSSRPKCEGHKRNDASFGTIASSSGYLPYLSGPNASWMIAAPEASSYTFTIDMLSLNPDIDYVTIYNGPSEMSGIAHQFTGTSQVISPVTINADSVLITFTSTNPNATNEDYYGFKMSYTSTLPEQYCDEYSNMTYQVNGHISDKNSGTGKYLPQTSCTWLLQPTFITGFVFVFSKFDLKHGDFVDIYDASQTPAKLWKRFDIYDSPDWSVYNFPYQKMRINFVSDNWLEGEGFEISFFAITGIEENGILSNVSLFPNPASEFISLSSSLENEEHIQYQIFDVSGKMLKTEQFYHPGGEHSKVIPISELASGFYIMHIQTSKGKTIRKFMVQ